MIHNILAAFIDIPTWLDIEIWFDGNSNAWVDIRNKKKLKPRGTAWPNCVLQIWISYKSIRIWTTTQPTHATTRETTFGYALWWYSEKESPSNFPNLSQRDKRWLIWEKVLMHTLRSDPLLMILKATTLPIVYINDAFCPDLNKLNSIQIWRKIADIHNDWSCKF